MHEAVDILEAAIPTSDRVEVYAVTHKALASAIKVIAKAMTPARSSVVLAVASSSFIPRLPRQHRCPASNLVDWMMRFQFDGGDWPFSTATSTPSSAATPATGRWPLGSRTRPRPS
ncbi:MAG TPA: hypothetical protein VK390_01495, partial [Propionibacteriaceae bacterium]|nr:hypothetical protein [Propionibacteriaceae bacterium]